MIFGEMPVAQATGAILAHSISLEGRRLRKGVVLTADDVVQLIDAGHGSVTVAQLEQGDLDENVAAATLADALADAEVRVSQASTGRVNIFAKHPGIAAIDRAAVDAFNAVNPMITVATVPPLYRLDAGTMIATIKVISYAVPTDDVAKACHLGAGAIGVLAPIYQTASLIETQIGQPVTDKGAVALRSRLGRFGVSLDDHVIIPHKAEALSAAIAAAQGQVLFILTGSATSDPADVGPTGLRKAGGSVTQFGMPVDPGNLLFLGALGDRPVIGLPGCARSPAMNGADWVLERVVCGVTLTSVDFASMGVGGLLKEIPTRPKPRGDI